MALLPVVTRELRVLARGPRLYWQRAGVALVAMLICGGLLLLPPIVRMGSTPQTVFTAFTQLWFFYLVFFGCSPATDCISREIREGTLGLLFLTPLKGRDIVLAKLISTSLITLHHLLAVLPILTLPILLGGVSAREAGRITAALLNTLFFVQAFALLISAFYREARRGRVVTIIVLWLWVIVVPSFAMFYPRPAAELLHWLAMASPRYAFSQASNLSYSSGAARAADSFWTSLLLSNGTAWLFLIIASWRVRRCWRERSIGAGRRRWQEAWQRFRYGDASVREARRQRWMPIDPYYWLITRLRSSRMRAWILLSAAGLLAVIIHSAQGQPSKGELFFLAVSFGLVLKLAAALSISSMIESQKRTGELELLLAGTPLGIPEITRGIWLAYRKGFTLPLFVVLGLDLLFLACGCLTQSGQFSGLPAETAFVLAMVALMGLLIADLWALGWVAIWTGITSPKPSAGGATAFARVVILPCVVWGLFLAFLAMAPPTPEATFVFGLVLWMVVGLFNNSVWVQHSRRKISTEFRSYAMTYQDEKLTFLGRLGRSLGRAWAGRTHESVN